MRQGNELAFTELYRLYSGKLYAFSFKFLASDDLAKEIVHDVFVSIWERKEKIDPEKSFDSYLFTITKNKAIDLISSYTKEARFMVEYGHSRESVNDVDESFSFKEIKKLEEETVCKFPTQRKLVYRLSREEYLSYDEIASKLGISKNSVKTHLKLALRELRKNIEPVTNISISIILFFQTFL